MISALRKVLIGLCLLIVVAPTVAFFFANKLNKDIQASREQEVKADWEKLQRTPVERRPERPWREPELRTVPRDVHLEENPWIEPVISGHPLDRDG